MKLSRFSFSMIRKNIDTILFALILVVVVYFHFRNAEISKKCMFYTAGKLTLKVHSNLAGRPKTYYYYYYLNGSWIKGSIDFNSEEIDTNKIYLIYKSCDDRLNDIVKHDLQTLIPTWYYDTIPYKLMPPPARGWKENPLMKKQKKL